MNSYFHMKTIGSDDDFEFMGDTPKEDPVIAERRRIRENEITKKLGEYLLKGYCMLNDSCQDCHCILLRTPEQQLLCVNCNKIDIEKNNNENKESIKKKKNEINYCNQLENKLKWAVNHLIKSQNPNHIIEMCSVIIKLTETIKTLKEHKMRSS